MAIDDIVSPTGAFLDRLIAATNAHDLDALVDCFAEDYLNESPVHPTRGFRGRDQVRRNWEQIFAGVPDIVLTVPRRVVTDDTVWAEMDLRGTRRDGAPHHMAGVVVFGVDDRRADWVRFYLEPVDADPLTADEAVHVLVGPR